LVVVVVVEEAGGRRKRRRIKEGLVVVKDVYDYERIIWLCLYCNTFLTKGLWEHFLLGMGGGRGKRLERGYLPLLHHTPSWSGASK
jgi:hypothetical protein